MSSVGDVSRLQIKVKNLTFIIKKRKQAQQGQFYYKADLYCLTNLQGFRLEPVMPYWQRKYNNLVALAALSPDDIDTLDKLAEWCNDVYGNETIRWVAVTKKYI